MGQLEVCVVLGACRRRQMRWERGATPTPTPAAPVIRPPGAPGRGTAASTCAGALCWKCPAATLLKCVLFCPGRGHCDIMCDLSEHLVLLP